MTNEDFRRLSPNKLYEFKLYYGPTHVGFPATENDRYYVVNPIKYQQNRSISGAGAHIKPESILDNPKPVSVEEFHQKSIFYANSFALPSSNNKVFKMVIIGAGASYDYTYDIDARDEDRPPLTANLFNDRYHNILKKYPGAESLSGELLRVLDIEMYLQKQWLKIENTHNPTLLRNLINLQFYLRELFDDISNKYKTNRRSNYRNLVRLLDDYLKNSEHRNESVIVVNFNYDTLMEEALINILAYSYSSLDDYVDFKNKRILLFKPHGSWNWGRQFDVSKLSVQNVGTNERFAFELYSKNYPMPFIEESLSNNIEIVNAVQPNNVDKVPKYYFPWLLIPYRDKDEFVMPSKHEAILNHLLENVNDILVIGWKGSEDHFLKFLKNGVRSSNPKIVYVNNGAKDIEEYFKKQQVFNATDQWIEFNPGDRKKTFTNYIDWYFNQPKEIFS